MHSNVVSSRNAAYFLAAILTMCFLFAAWIPYSIASSAADTGQSIVNPKQMYTYEILTRDMKALAKQYPDLIRYRSIGKSEFGRDLWLMEVGRGPTNVLLNGSHHAREWISTLLLMEMSEHIAASERSDVKWGSYRVRDLLDHVTFQIVPMVNPDGVTLQQKGLQAFSKKEHAALLKMNKGSRNFKRWKANAKGVDLNRQYPAGWSSINNPAPGPSYMNYKGKKPLEAKEAQAMYKLANSLQPAVAVSYHSSGEILYWNYKTPSANVPRDLQLATAYANMTGYRLFKPVAHPSGGGFTDWFIEQFDQPGLTPELSPSVGERDVPLSKWERIWKQHRDTAWLIGTTAVRLTMEKLKPVEASGRVEVGDEAMAYEQPELNAATYGALPAGTYSATRTKGSWVGITLGSGSVWISNRHVKWLPAEPEESGETLQPETPQEASPIADAK